MFIYIYIINIHSIQIYFVNKTFILFEINLSIARILININTFIFYLQTAQILIIMKVDY